MSTRELSWFTRQYIAAILALLGFLSTGFTGVLAWTYRDLAGEVRDLMKTKPVLEQRLQDLQRFRDASEGYLKTIQEGASLRTTSQAVLEERLKALDTRLQGIENQMQQLITYIRATTPKPVP